MPKPKRRSPTKAKRKVVRAHKRSSPSSKARSNSKALPEKEVKVVLAFLKSSARYWHKDAFRHLAPQGVPTLTSRIAAAKSAILSQVIASIEAREHFECVFLEEDQDDG